MEKGAKAGKKKQVKSELMKREKKGWLTSRRKVDYDNYYYNAS